MQTHTHSNLILGATMRWNHPSSWNSKVAEVCRRVGEDTRIRCPWCTQREAQLTAQWWQRPAVVVSRDRKSARYFCRHERRHRRHRARVKHHNHQAFSVEPMTTKELRILLLTSSSSPLAMLLISLWQLLAESHLWADTCKDRSFPFHFSRSQIDRPSRSRCSCRKNLPSLSRTLDSTRLMADNGIPPDSWWACRLASECKWCRSHIWKSNTGPNRLSTRRHEDELSHQDRACRIRDTGIYNKDRWSCSFHDVHHY